MALGEHSVTLLDLATRPLASCLTENQSQQLLDAWKSLPLTFVGSVQVVDTREQSIAESVSVKQITTECGKVFTVDHIIVTAGLQTPNRLARSAGLAWNNGIDVQAETLATRVAGIHALGDCIAIKGQVSRYIEPIGRQANTLAAAITNDLPVPYRQTGAALRIKTSSMPFTV